MIFSASVNIRACIFNPPKKTLRSESNKKLTEVEIISKETEEGEMIYKALGGFICLIHHL